jgi:hypothetical protein
MKFHKNPSSETSGILCGLMDIYDEATRRFSQLLGECAENASFMILVHTHEF